MDQTARIDITMAVGQASQTVEVSTAPPLLQTDQTFLGTVLDAQANVTLPLATRNYNQLTLLSPGAVSLNPGAFTGSQASFQVGRPYINGNREQTNNYILDGMDNNQIDNNDVAFAPSVDAIQEFNLISQNAPASYGNYLGGIISVTIKSGTNNFHGDVFEFIRNNALNANTWANGLTKGEPYIPGVNNPDGTGLKPILRWNEFGGSVGGPIIKDKLFFFVDYQGSRYDQPATSVPYTVFTTAERKGNFSSVCTAGFDATGLCINITQQLYNPYSAATPAGRQPFLNNIITVPFSPAATNILTSTLYPAPINGLNTNNQVNVTHSYTNSDQGDLKIDWSATEKDHVYGRYSQQHISNPTTNSQLLTGNSDNEFPLYNGVINYTHTFSPFLLNRHVSGPATSPSPRATPIRPDRTFRLLSASPEPRRIKLSCLYRISPAPATGRSSATTTSSRSSMTPSSRPKTPDRDSWKAHLNFGFEFYNYRTNILYVGNAGLAGDFTYNGSFTCNPSTPEHGAPLVGSRLPAWLPQNVAWALAMATACATACTPLRSGRLACMPNLTLNLGLRYEVITAARRP